MIERELIFSRGPQLHFESLGNEGPASTSGWRNPAWRVPEQGFTIDSMVEDLISDVLRETNHNISATARRLGVTREFLRYRLKDRESKA